ncbi:MAG: recombinase family protein, partial [Candidatus Hydrogenedens sp.]|nr:recombinase family protein [Candidatus Hydrogenedens sp.]
MGRKRRVQNSAGAGPLPRTWRVGLYIRLSREDAHSGGESESVANQRAILLEHIANLKDGDAYIAAGEYVDDGVSGATDDGREGFLALLEDIRR